MDPEDEKLNTDELLDDTIDEKDKEDVDVTDSFVDSIFKDNCLDLIKLEGLKVKDQSKVFNLILHRYYAGNDDVDESTIRKNALKCLKLSCDPEDNKMHLPYRLMTRKLNGKMYFDWEDKTKRNLFLFLIILGLFVLAALGSTYTTLHLLSIAHLNKDIDGDTIADLNLDLNGDEKEEVNIDTDKDDKPNINIDYKGGRISIFNVDTDGDGKPDTNLINQDTDNDGKCDINCDTNDDGWPDTNLDLDGDGKPDMYLDIDDDGEPDLNFDLNKDLECDMHCDTDDDDKCDKFCLEDTDDINHNPNGSTALVGNTETDIDTAEFIVSFVDSKLISISGLFPDDQENAPGTLADRLSKDNNFYPTKGFSVENKSPVYVKYSVELVVTQNNFITDNFKYKIKCTNSGFSTNYKTVPKITSMVSEEGIVIPPEVKQECTITFKLQGINAQQNDDQGRTFAGYFQIYIVEQLGD